MAKTVKIVLVMQESLKGKLVVVVLRVLVIATVKEGDCKCSLVAADVTLL